MHKASASRGQPGHAAAAIVAAALVLAACAPGGGASHTDASRADRTPPSGPEYAKRASAAPERSGRSRSGALPRRLLLGRSGQGRPIHALRVGGARTRLSLLVVGAVHGNEPGGKAVVARLRRANPPRGTGLWLVGDLNPDGAAAGTRQNAAGVDLNRNFPYRWSAAGSPFDTYHSGAGPLSEPESRAVARFVERVRPRVTIWYHQALGIVVRGEGDPALERLYSRRSGLPRGRLPRYRGTAVSWQNQRFSGDSSFVVELPGGPLSPTEARRHAGAVLALARAIAPPRVVERPLPFGDRRKREMRAYARRHYGIDDHQLRNPRVVVQHYTVTDSFAPVYDYFASDAPDPELRELPGVCSHYVIDRDGTIYRLVSTRIMCRHTVGLNWTAIGVEHVGRSDGQILANRRQLAASLRLARMLQGRFGIRTRDVIGHNESRSSAFHRERVARLRGQTHGDFRHGSMVRYRRLLERLPAPASMR